MRKTCLLIAVLFFAEGPPVEAGPREEFVLDSGGRVAGELLNPDQFPRTDYVVRTDDGVVFKIERSQVVETGIQRPEAVAYERIWPRFADTVEDQWKLAEWCRENTLLEQRNNHLERILQLDPDHADARRILGYMRRDGQWTTRSDEYRDRGYVHFEGKWRTPQEIQLIESARRHDEAQREWTKKIKNYRDQLKSGNGAAEARQAILAIDDPAALSAVTAALSEESNPHTRELFLHALGNIPGKQTIMLLAAAYMEEPVEDLQLTCLDLLHGSPLATQYFVGLLNDKKPEKINKAGYALGSLGDPTAIAPLIRALNTVHKYRIQKGGSGQMSTGFDSRGGMSFGAGGSVEIRDVPSQNRAVLDALVKITGQNYGFNEAQWRNWHAAQRRYEHVNSRRD